MAATETAICNQALLKCGQAPIDDIDGTDVQEEKCAIIFDETRDSTLTDGPEDGWEFAKFVYHGIDRNSTAITAFADYSGTVAGTTSVTSTAHGLESGDMATIDGTTSYDGTYDVTKIDANTYYITKDFVADDATGTSYWTSAEFEYRYAIPTCLSVLKVKVGGLELTDWKERGAYIVTNMESSEVDMEIVQAITDVTLFPSYFVELFVVKLAINLHYNLTQDLNAIQLLERELMFKKNTAFAMDERRKYVQEKSTSWVDAGHTTEMIE